MERTSKRMSLKFNYRKILEVSLLFSLMILIFIFQAFKQYEHKADLVIEKSTSIIIEQIPLTEILTRPPVPPRPRVLLPTEDDSVPFDLTLASTEINFKELPPDPPKPKEYEKTPEFFWRYEKSPTPIGGYKAILKNLIYPEMARRAGIEGTVVILAAIDIKGIIKETKVFKTLGNNGCDNAAIKAIRSVKWEPAYQRDKPVPVWISIPIQFKLKSEK
jgi:periplasmic protein TonB